jgi:hypothetical protein
LNIEEEMTRKGKDFSAKSGKEFSLAVKKAQSFYQKYATADEVPDDQIPDSYDMRDLDGYDFTNPLRD